MNRSRNPNHEFTMSIDVSELKTQINGTVLIPVDEGYAESLHRWAENAGRKAAAVVLVTSSADVSAAVIHSFSLTDLPAGVCHKEQTRNCNKWLGVIQHLAPLRPREVQSLT
jgi:hypothetical protein